MMLNVANVIQYSDHIQCKADNLHKNTRELNSKCDLKSASQEMSF